MVITPNKHKSQSTWGQAKNIKFLIFFLLVRKWNKDTDTVAYELKNKTTLFWCVLVMTALKIRAIFKLSKNHFFSEPKDSYSILKIALFKVFWKKNHHNGSQLIKSDL